MVTSSLTLCHACREWFGEYKMLYKEVQNQCYNLLLSKKANYMREENIIASRKMHCFTIGAKTRITTMLWNISCIEKSLSFYTINWHIIHTLVKAKENRSTIWKQWWVYTRCIYESTREHSLYRAIILILLKLHEFANLKTYHPYSCRSLKNESKV